MTAVEQPDGHLDETRQLVDLAGSRFAAVVVVITLGIPVVTYLSRVEAAMFYVHVALAAFWFGFDFFFKFVLGPSLDDSPDDAATAVNEQLIPKMVVVAEPLSVGVVASGIALAEVLGYWQNPTVWLHGALGLGILMLLVGFGPLHVITTKMAVEYGTAEPDPERLDALFGKALQWGLVQTVLMLAILATMVGMRGLI